MPIAILKAKSWGRFFIIHFIKSKIELLLKLHTRFPLMNIVFKKMKVEKSYSEFPAPLYFTAVLQCVYNS